MTATELKNQVKISILSSKAVVSPFVKNNKPLDIHSYLGLGMADCINENYCRKYYLELRYNNKSYRFSFYDSIYNYQHNKKLNKLDTIYAVLMDSQSYEYSRSYQEFCREFGYNSYGDKEAVRAYHACKKTFEALHDIFSSDELEKLRNEFQDY